MNSFISTNLKTLRSACEMTQNEFSKKIGVRRSALGAYEENRATPPLKILINICNKFNTTLDEFCKGYIIVQIESNDPIIGLITINKREL